MSNIKKSKSKVENKEISTVTKKSKGKNKEDLEVITFKFQVPNWTFVLLIVLFGVAIGQALLLFRLSDQVKAQDGGNVPTFNNVSNTPDKQIQDLPDMVGGC